MHLEKNLVFLYNQELLYHDSKKIKKKLYYMFEHQYNYFHCYLYVVLFHYLPSLFVDLGDFI